MSMTPEAKKVRIEAMVSAKDVENIYPAGCVKVVFVVDPRQMLPPISGQVTRLSCEKSVVAGKTQEMIKLAIEVQIEDIAWIPDSLDSDPASFGQRIVALPRGQKIVLGQVI